MEDHTLPVDEGPSAAPRELVLVARAEGRELGRRMLRPEDPELIVGSELSCGLRLEHPSVSRRHLAISPRLGGVLARDLGSTNGTGYQGSKLTEALLPAGAALMLGKVELRIEPVEPGGTLRLGSLASISPVFGRLIDTLRKAAATDVTVLLEGETGTGKDVCARAIHACSPRANGPFETVDCGSLPKDLAQAELFGHEKGAFTGADRARPGALERAGGGTLFLDEVGELPLELQPLLLRALEARQVRRVGGAAFVPIDVRIVGATNRNLDAEVKAGRFRTDLLHRLAVVRVTVPRLADRLEDLPLLARAILESLGSRGAGISLSETTLAALRSQPWPGNVRELRNFLERAITLGDVRAEPKAPGAPTLAAFSEDYRSAREQALEAFERDFAGQVLQRAGGNVSQAARTAGIGRAYLHKLIKRHGLDSVGAREPPAKGSKR